MPRKVTCETTSHGRLKEGLPEKRACDASEVKGGKDLHVIRIKLIFQELTYREVRRKEPKNGRVHTKLPEIERRKSWVTCSPGGAQDPETQVPQLPRGRRAALHSISQVAFL